jgi:hypothetical protein
VPVGADGARRNEPNGGSRIQQKRAPRKAPQIGRASLSDHGAVEQYPKSRISLRMTREGVSSVPVSVTLASRTQPYCIRGPRSEWRPFWRLVPRGVRIVSAVEARWRLFPGTMHDCRPGASCETDAGLEQAARRARRLISDG